MSENTLTLEQLREYMHKRSVECNRGIMQLKEGMNRGGGDDQRWSRIDVLTTRFNLYCELVKAIDTGELPT